MKGRVLLVSMVLGLVVFVGCGEDRKELSHLPYCQPPQPGQNARTQQQDAAVDSDLSASPWHVASSRPWKYIVIHHSAGDTGSAKSFDRLHTYTRGWDELGYHFVITNGNGGPDGQVQIGSRWKKQKWGAHCGGTPNNDYNNFGIGICLVGDFTKKMPTQKQLESLEKLTEFLVAAYGMNVDNILAHRDAPGANTACCGRVLWAYIHAGKFRDSIKDNSYLASSQNE